MARRRTNKGEDETLIDIVEVKESASSFFENYQNVVLGALFIIVLIIGGVFAYNNFYKKPRQQEAIQQIRQAQVQFEQDSFAIALSNPGGGYPGFLEIIETYGGTETGNLAHYYAGISYLNLGDYENAISYLKDFDADGKILPITKQGALGDAYSEQGDMDAAKKAYKRAINAGDHEVLTGYYMKKLAMLHENEGNPEEALTLYQDLQEEYPNSAAAGEVEKYIARIKRAE